MTWRYQATLSDHIHRLDTATGEAMWGIEHEGRDEDHPLAHGTAEVALPAGRARLLVVEPLPGGLVLDIVRSYRGLTPGELSTLFLGFFEELRVRPDTVRLTLEAIGLDAEGRPRIIPGIGAPQRRSARRALGEMLYEAAYGASWSASLLPVSFALEKHPEPLQTLVADLLNDPADAPAPATRLGSSVDPGTDPAVLDSAIAEVSACLRATTTPTALPLLPAERDLDPSQALTARLRAGSVLEGLRRPAVPAAPVETVPDRRAPDEGAETIPAATPTPSGPDPAGRLRRASRSRTERQRWRGRLQRLRLPRLRLPALRPGILLIGTCLAVIGAAIMFGTWSTEPTQQGTPAESGRPAESAPRAAGEMSEEDVYSLLDELCDRRAEALTAGDAAGLKGLTAPGSAAAVADELIDVEDFVGSEYTIDLDSLSIKDRGESALVVAARMTTSATTAGEEVRFDAEHVEFHLELSGGEWKVAEVIETAG